MEREKEALLHEIEKLLSFDGRDTAINPDYLAYFTLEELTNIKKELEERHERMVENHLEWMQRFKTNEETLKSYEKADNDSNGQK
jgi:hypothetical protein